MILRECEDCVVKSVGGVCLSARHGNGSKWKEMGTLNQND